MRTNSAAPFGELLKRYRLAAGLSQEELAERAGLSPRGVSDLERGARTQPRPGTVRLLADALGLGGDDRAAFVAAARRTSALTETPTASDSSSEGATDSSEPPHLLLPIGGFLGALPDSPLVARNAEMKQLDALLLTVAHGAGRFVMLDGEPGVGKTRLAQEVMLSARNLGFLIAAGRCYEPHAAVAYFPFLEALHQVYAQTPPAIRTQVPKRWAEVALLIPDLDIALNSPPESRGERGAEEQQRLFWKVASYLEALAELQPIAVLLDDLQWADSATLALVEHLARHTHSAPIFLLGTCRDVVVHRQHPLEAALRDLTRERLVERIAVRPFSATGTSALLRTMAGEADVSQEFADLLYSRAEGNAFFTREILLALVERGDIYRSADGGWSRRAIEEIDVPASVRSVIDERVARLSPEAQEALREASVLGQTFTFEEIRALTNQDETTLEQALEESSAARLVHDAGWESYAFHHALIQQALYAEIPTRRKRRLHRKAGEAMEQMAERERIRRVAELTWHFLQAGERSRALPYALIAGDQAEAIYAHVEAELHFRTALELARQVDDEAHETEALEKLGAVLSAQSRYDDAIELLEQAYAHCDGMGDLEGRWRNLAQIGWALAERGTPEEGITRLRAELAAAHTLLPSATLAQLYFTLAQLWFANAHVPESSESAVKAVQLAREAGDDRLELRALSLEANAVGVIGDAAEAVRLCESIVPRAESLGDYWTLVRTHHTLHRDLAHMGQLESAQAHAERWIAACERLGSPTELAFALNEQAGDYYQLGDWVRFRAGMERALGLLRHIPAASMLPMLHTDLGMLDMYQGNLEAARERLHQARALAETGRNLDYLRRVACVESEHDLLQGHPEVARERLEPLLDRSGKETYEVTTFLLPMLAWAQLDLGDAPRADTLIEEGIARAERAHMTAPLIVLWRIQGLIRMRQQRWVDAASMLDKSLAASRRYLDVYSQVKALYVYGQLYVEQGQARRASVCWEQALAICRRLGERMYAERMEQEVAKLAATPAIAIREELS